MEKEEFLKEINNNIKNISLEESKNIIIEICKDMSEEYYYKVLCKIKNIKNTLEEPFTTIQNDIDKVYDDFKKVKEGDVVFRCYAINTGYYSPFGDDYDYYFYPTYEMNKILNRAYNLSLRLVFTKNYKEVLKIVDLILDTEYICEEISDPEYSDYEEVIDTFDTDIFSVKDNLDFYLDVLILYAVYAIIMSDEKDKFNKIDKYIKQKDIDIRKCKDLGIEEIPDFDKFYNEWLKYKKGEKI